MTPGKGSSVAAILNTLDHATLLGVIRYAQRRMNRDAVLLDLLQSRLRHLTSAPSVTDQDPDELLTADEAAKRLKLGRARVYELIHQGRLQSVRLGKQLRIR